MSETPRRIQRQRTKGWRMPENAVYVGRPTRFGNPFKVGMKLPEWDRNGEQIVVRDAAFAVALFRMRCNWRTGTASDAPSAYAKDLRGKNLACYCRLGEPCHADVLLEWANA